ncbi:MAG: MFS transporter [Candidatus Diapherotrites archaeon]
MNSILNQWSLTIWKIYAYEFLKGLHFFGAILIPFFTEWGHLNYEQIFLLQSWFLFWIFLLEIPTGSFADRFGRKYSLALGGILNALGALLYIAAPRFEVFLLAEFVWALSCAFTSGADEAILYDTLKSEKKENQAKSAFSWKESIGLIAIGIGSTIGSLTIIPFGLTFPYFLTAGVLFLSGLLAITIKEPKIISKKQKPALFTIMKEGLGYIRGHKTLQILAFDMISLSVVSYFMIWLFQPLIQNAGVSIAYFGLVHTGIIIAEVGLLALYPRIEKKLGKKRKLLFYTSILTGVFFIIAGITTNIPLLLLAIFLGGGIGLTRRPILMAYMQHYIPSDKRATIGSGISMLRTLSIAGANLIVGKLAEWNIPNTMIILGAAAIAFAMISKVEEEQLIG